MKESSVNVKTLFATTANGPVYSNVKSLELDKTEDLDKIDSLIATIQPGMVLPADKDIKVLDILIADVDLSKLPNTGAFGRKSNTTQTVYAILEIDGKPVRCRFQDLTEIPNLRNVPEAFLDANPKLAKNMKAYEEDTEGKEFLKWPASRSEAAKLVMGKTIRVVAGWASVPRNVTRQARPEQGIVEAKGQINTPIYFFEAKIK